MKICLLSNLFPPTVLGGAELSAYFTGKELVRRGHAVSVLTLADEDSVREEEGMRVYRFKARPLYSPFLAKKKPGWIKPAFHLADLYNPLMKAAVRRALETEAPDVLHCHNIVGFSCAVWDAAASAGVPVVQHLHDYHLVCPRATLMDERLDPCGAPHFPCNLRARHHFHQLDRSVREVISPSRFCADTVFGFSARTAAERGVSIVPNGTDYAERPATAADWDAPVLRILYLGGLFSHKGFPIFREVVESLNRKGQGFEFHIGGTGPLEPMARDLAARFPNVKYHGFVQGDLKESLFRQSHVFAFPSVWLENNPVSVTEALAVGLPVLGSDIGGVPELLAPVSRELLVPPGSADAVEARLLAFLRDRGILRGISASLLPERSRYGIKAQVDRTLEVYRRAASRAGT